ncbi:hypothetical protein [Mesorhizobium sp.]|uniref:hypothetical protein n=1 Tax=Mesorhizobium sp. TaxID=1871066 RepID=UPI000FE89F52|nr:hypothetical protein [Mesorhizobium sp.]RWE68080.1 MAG: hypothetical protein EOS62_12120 [Mesorhizobium sp.]
MNDIGTVIERIGEFRTHPLGFFYLLDKGVEGMSARVHVWLPAGSDRPENDRHQHSFDIHSTVRLGRMQSELFHFLETPGRGEQEFSVSYLDGKSILSATGRSGFLDPISRFDSRAGDSYFLQAGVIHRVAVVDRPCVTVLQTFEKGIPIYSYGSDAEEAPFERRLADVYEKDELMRVLKLVAD